MFKKAIKQGNEKAKNYLGNIYFNLGKNYRDGSDKDDKKAAEMFQEAAKYEHIDAMCCLGQMHLYGQGVSLDDKEAFKLFEKASDGGSLEASFNLGLMYYNGFGVKRSIKEATKYFKKAADYPGAKKALELIASEK